MGDFESNPKRDAWQAIRGFVQQVHITIWRWLDLPTDAAMDLERGEDIDHIAAAVAADSSTARLLEQIKVSESSITLRSPANAEAFANLIEHRRLNPGLRLRVRITTTAPRGAERPTIFADRRAIDVWEELSSIDAVARFTDEHKKNLATLREALLGLTKPDSFNGEVWTRFRSFVGNADEEHFHEFLRSIEWSKPVSLGADMLPDLRLRLQQLGIAGDEAHANQLIERLFMHVFQLLSTRGLKRLRASDLQQLVDQPTLSQADHLLLASLRDAMSQLAPRVDAVESAIVDIRRQQAIDASVLMTVELPALAPPLPAVPLCDRSSAIHSLRGSRKLPAGWVHVHGSVGSGRAQLALQWIGGRDRCPFWLRCSEYDAPLTIRALETVVGQMVPDASPVKRYAAFAAMLGPGKFVVLQDLPALQADDQLATRLTQLSEAFAVVGATLITTSVRPLPTSLVSALGDDIVHAPVPAFSDGEIATWVKAAGAPNRWAQGTYPHFVNLMGLGHGRLLAATLNELREHGWTMSEELLGRFVHQQHVAEVKDAALQLVMRRLPDADTRDLLYRLGLLGHDFSAEEANRIAAVEPAILRTGERLLALRSLCVEPDRRPDRLSVSPMFGGIGADSLPADTRRGCHAAAADWILKAPSIDVLGVLRALTHLVKSGQDDRAASLLFVAIAEALGRPDNSAIRLLASIWADPDVPAPAGISRPMRILLRGFQIVLRAQLGLQMQHLLDELEPLISTAKDPEDALAAVVAGTRVGIAFSDTDASIALRYTAFACRSAPYARHADGTPANLPTDPPLEMMPFINSMGIRTPAHLALLLDALETLPAQVRHQVGCNAVAIEASFLALQHILTACEASQEQARWSEIRADVQAMADRAAALSQPVLAAACSAAAARILASQENNPDAALVLMERHKHAFTPVGTVVLCQWGGDALLNSRRERATELIQLADAQPGSELPYQRMLAAALLSTLAGNDPKGEALRLLRRAMEWAVLSDNEAAVASIWGELAIAQHLAGDPQGALKSLHELVRAISTRLGNRAFDELLAPAGHLLAFLNAPAQATVASGSVPPPTRGAFLRAHAYTSTKPAPELLLRVEQGLAIRAAQQGHQGMAAYWDQRAADLEVDSE